jgi:hypothetical protein
MDLEMTETVELERPIVPASPTEAATSSSRLPNTRVEGIAIAAVMAVAYAAIGYWTVVSGHIVQFEALERLADAYMVWWNDPPKLAAIGLELAPVGTLVFLPLTLLKPLATSLIVLPVVTALAAGGALAMLNTLLARCELGRAARYAILALIGANPMFVFYAVNGSTEALGLFLAAAALLALVSWRIMDETRYLVGAGMAIGVAVLVDYTYLTWALGIMLAIAFAGPGPKGGQAKLRSSLLLFLTPAVYSVLVWTILNGVILDNPFQWLEIGAVQTPTNVDPAVAQGPASLGPALGDLAEVVFGVAPLAFLILPLLLVSAIGRRDSLSSGLIGLLLLIGAAIVGNALLDDRADLVSLSTALPIAITAVAAMAWLYRTEEGWRVVLGGAAIGFLALAIPLSWNAMRNFEYQDQAQAFTRFLETRESQEGTSSLGGYEVGIDPELAMADFIDNRLEPGKDSILTDSSLTYGVILLSGRPDLFVDRADVDEGEWLSIRDNPFGQVDYMLVTYDTHDDLIRARYADLDLGTQPGLAPIFHTDRYVLIQVDGGAVAANGAVSPPSRVRSQPRLITPDQPLSPPPAVTQPSEGLRDSLSPLPDEPAQGASGEAAAPADLDSAPEVEGE